LLGAALSAAACAPRARMCTSPVECRGPAACVAGRCQPDKPNVKPAIDSARRMIARPIDLAYLRRGEPAGAALAPVFVLGRDGAVLLLRFSVNLAPGANVVEAYLVLHRSEVVDDDPAPIALHATRIVEAWSGRSTSWAFQPQTQETRSPSTVVEPYGPSIVRLDVRDLVRQWTRRDPADHGIAIVADDRSKTGMTFALTQMGVEQEPSPFEVAYTPGPFTGRLEGVHSSSAPDVEPYLELYVR
jgi:hypothetical protein